jgi:hypothetical protein
MREAISLRAVLDKNTFLPNHYSIVPAVAAKKKLFHVPKVVLRSMEADELEKHCNKEYEWLTQASETLNATLTKDDNITWASFHASQSSIQPRGSAITSLLPLFHEKSSSLAMIKHGMNVQ